MTQPLVAVVMALALHAEPGSPPAAELVPEAPPGANIGFSSDYDDPPEGSEAELALWKDGIAATQRIVEVRRESYSLRAKGRGADLGGRLTKLQGSAGHEQAEELQKLGRRLDKSWAENVDLYRRQWPVDPTRGCGYAHLLYDNALRLAPGSSRQAEVSNATPELKSCVDRARSVTGQMAASNRRLAGVMNEVEQVLARAKGAPPAAGARAAEGHEAHEGHEQKREGK